MIEIDYIKGLKTTEVFGIAKYQREIHERLKGVELNVIEYTGLGRLLGRWGRAILLPRFQGRPLASPLGSVANNTFINRIRWGSDIIDRYLRYPFLVRKRVKKGNIRHVTSQELAYLLRLIKLKKTIVTCYDLIPYIYSNTRSLYWRLNISGMKKADRIITISEFSKNDIVKHVGYPEAKIRVVYPGVDHDLFYVKRGREILQKYDIPDDQKIVLYVGSEHPRQNVPLLIKAFGRLRGMLPEVKLLKVGNPQWRGAREELLRLIEELNLQNDVIFVGYVAEEELPRWYNCADLFVYPCLYTGFSLPCVEAMACGTPVITSNVSVLPEVVGEGGITVDPYDVEGLARVMYEVLTDPSLREDLIQKGLQRARMFSWDKAAEETLKVYEEIQ